MSRARRGAARVAVGSANPVKLRAVQAAFAEALGPVEVMARSVASSVPDQPTTDEDTLRGAEQRARAALALGDADFGVGIESGVARVGDGVYALTWAVVCDSAGALGRGGSARVEVPAGVAARLRGGSTLQEAVEAETGIAEAGRGDGLVGLVSGGRLTRFDVTLQALHLALAPVLQRHAESG